MEFDSKTVITIELSPRNVIALFPRCELEATVKTQLHLRALNAPWLASPRVPKPDAGSVPAYR